MYEGKRASVPVMAEKIYNVLFLCTGNSARSSHEGLKTRGRKFEHRYQNDKPMALWL
jgi:hypothetical protein